jgi:hypothetical protein
MILPERVFGRSETRYCGGQRGTQASLVRSALRVSTRTHNILGRRKRPNHLADLDRQLLGEGVFLCRLEVEFGLHRHKGIHSLASDIIVASDDGRLGDSLVEDEGRLDLGGGQAVARDAAG